MTMANTYPEPLKYEQIIFKTDVISPFRINPVALQRYTDERKKLSDFGRRRLIVKRTRKTATIKTT